MSEIEALAANLAHRIAAVGVTQAELVRRTGLHWSVIRRVRRGDIGVRGTTLAIVDRALQEIEAAPDHPPDPREAAA